MLDVVYWHPQFQWIKVYTKIIVDHIGIDQAKFVHVRESDFEHLEEAMDRGKGNSISNLRKTILCRIF